MRKIPLKRGYLAMVDDEDYSKVISVQWRIIKGRNTLYAITGNTVSMSRFLLAPPKDFQIDHIDGNGLNNIRSNLRLVTHRENLLNRKVSKNKNSSCFKGVYRHCSGKWHVGIKHNGEQKYLGIFSSEIEAAFVYDNAAKILFGKFARLNITGGLFYEI